MKELLTCLLKSCTLTSGFVTIENKKLKDTTNQLVLGRIFYRMELKLLSVEYNIKITVDIYIYIYIFIYVVKYCSYN